MTDDEQAIEAMASIPLPDRPRLGGAKTFGAYFTAGELLDFVTALRALGWRKVGEGECVVPMEPTAKMLDAGIEVRDWSPIECYRAMIAAAKE